MLEPGGLIEFVENVDFRNYDKTCVNLVIEYSLRPPKRQTIQFYTGFVSVFDIVNFHKIDLLSVASK